METTVLPDVAALVALLTGIVTIALQVVKPLLEQIPLLQKNVPVHDAVLRLVNLALQGGLLVLVRLTLPTYVSLTWLDLLALTFGQGMLAHSAYQVIKGAPAQPVTVTVPPVGPVA